MTMAITARCRIAIPVVLLLALASCKFGGWRGTEKSTPFGAQVRLTTESGESFEGELLLADSESLLIAVGPELIRVAWEAVDEFQVPRHPVDRVRGGDRPSDSDLRQIQLASRYPYGLSEDQLAQLLAERNQARVREVR